MLHIIRKEIFHLNRYVFPLILLRIGGYVKFGGTGNHIKNGEFSQGQKADDNNDRYNSSYRQGFFLTFFFSMSNIFSSLVFL